MHEDPLLSLNMANSFNCMHKNIKLLFGSQSMGVKRGRSNMTTCFALPCSQSSSSTWMHIKELRCVLPIWTAGRSATRLDDFISVQSTQRPVYRQELPCIAVCAVQMFSVHCITSLQSVIAAGEHFLWLIDLKVPSTKTFSREACNTNRRVRTINIRRSN